MVIVVSLCVSVCVPNNLSNYMIILVHLHLLKVCYAELAKIVTNSDKSVKMPNKYLDLI